MIEWIYIYDIYMSIQVGQESFEIYGVPAEMPWQRRMAQSACRMCGKCQKPEISDVQTNSLSGEIFFTVKPEKEHTNDCIFSDALTLLCYELITGHTEKPFLTNSIPVITGAKLDEVIFNAQTAEGEIPGIKIYPKGDLHAVTTLARYAVFGLRSIS